MLGTVLLTNLQLLKTAIPTKCNKAKLNKLRYPCNSSESRYLSHCFKMFNYLTYFKNLKWDGLVALVLYHIFNVASHLFGKIFPFLQKGSLEGLLSDLSEAESDGKTNYYKYKYTANQHSVVFQD